MIKNVLPDKSGNPKIIKKKSQKCESFSTNAPIVGEDLLRVFYSLFYGSTVFQFKWSVKKHCVANVLLAILEIICTDLVANAFLSFFFCPFLQAEKNNQVWFSASWGSGNEK